jgi:hypothetical protein
MCCRNQFKHLLGSKITKRADCGMRVRKINKKKHVALATNIRITSSKNGERMGAVQGQGTASVRRKRLSQSSFR